MELATVQQLPDRLKLYCQELTNELPLIKTWVEPRINTLSPEEFAKRLKKALAEIIFITGGKMYDEKDQATFYKIQLQSISKFLLNSFYFLSFPEIIQAFYENAAGRFKEKYSHYGRELNIEFIGNVLSDYKAYKQGLFNQYGHELVTVINIPKEVPAPIVLTDEDYMNDKRLLIEETYQRLLKDLDMNDELFPEFFYDVLEADGAIAKGLFEKKQVAAKRKIGRDAQTDIMHKESLQAKDGEKRIHDTKGLQNELEKIRKLCRLGKAGHYRPIVTVSKQMIVKEYFLFCMGAGDKHIYEIKSTPKP